MVRDCKSRCGFPKAREWLQLCVREGASSALCAKGEGFGERGSQMGNDGRADDGKHASSVIEVDISPQGQEEREVWRERARPRVWEHADLQSWGSLERRVSEFFFFLFW